MGISASEKLLQLARVSRDTQRAVAEAKKRAEAAQVELNAAISALGKRASEAEDAERRLVAAAAVLVDEVPKPPAGTTTNTGRRT